MPGKHRSRGHDEADEGILERDQVGIGGKKDSRQPLNGQASTEKTVHPPPTAAFDARSLRAPVALSSRVDPARALLGVVVALRDQSPIRGQRHEIARIEQDALAGELGGKGSTVLFLGKEDRRAVAQPTRFGHLEIPSSPRRRH